MKKYLIFGIILSALAISEEARSQGRRGESKIMTYETIYDDPMDINKLWIGFQPIYADVFTQNINVGFGLDASYYWAQKADFRAHFRKPYNQHLDQQRYLAMKNSEAMDNLPLVYNYLEFGGTYHIQDAAEDTETFIYLYSKRYKGNKWASMNPDKSKVQTQVRKILGGRAGAWRYQSSVELSRDILDKSLTLEQIAAPTNPDFTAPMVLDSMYIDANEVYPFTNVTATGGYVGVSYAWIKNFAIDPDRNYDDLVKDLIFTAYFDILFAGRMDVENIFYRSAEYSADPLEKNNFGFRMGVDGKFNRTLGWGYGGELGIRPGLKKKGFYALLKITFPMYSSDMDNKVEAFSK